MLAFFPAAAGETAKRWLFTALDLAGAPQLALALAPNRATIVLYHGVCPPGAGEGIFNYRKKFITPEAFERQIAWIKRRYAILPLAELVVRLAGNGALPHQPLAITFDDGYENFYTHAFPILRKFQIPATVFIATDLIEPGRALWVDRLEYAIGASKTETVRVPCGGTMQAFPLKTYAERCRADAVIRTLIKQLPTAVGREILESVVAQTDANLNAAFAASPYRGLTWNQIREMQSAGITIAAHTRSHPILSRMAPAEIETEIVGSQMMLRERIGNPLNIFAYPNGQPGDFNADTIVALRKAGFRAALTTVPGFSRAGDDLFALPRMTLDNSEDMHSFRLTVTGIRSMLSSMRLAGFTLPTFRKKVGRASPAVSAGAFFDAAAKTYADKYEAQTPEGYSFRERKHLALGMLGDVRDRRVLDIGSGPGVLTGELLTGGAAVTAMDIAPAMIEALKARFKHPRLEAHVGDIEALQLPNESYDDTIVLGVLEYLDGDRRAFNELRRVLKPGGRAVISVPNYWSPWRLWNRILLAIFGIPWRMLQAALGRTPHAMRHREYSTRDIRRLARQFGFEIIDFAGYNFKLAPFPLDRLFGRLTAAAAECLSGLARTPLKFLGTGYLVTLRKR